MKQYVRSGSPQQQRRLDPVGANGERDHGFLHLVLLPPVLAAYDVCRSDRSMPRTLLPHTGWFVNAAGMHEFDAPRPTWLNALLEDVELAFEVTGADTPGWPDPHPDRSPLDEEYSRVSDVGKYRILETRVDAWVRVLADAGLATTREVPCEQWIAAVRPLAAQSRVRQIRPTVRGGLSLHFATTLVDGAPFGLDVAIARDGDRPVTLDVVPVCGCDACDSGSAHLIDQLDDRVLTTACGGVVHARRGEDSVTRMIDGWQGAGRSNAAWLDESSPVPDGIVRWVGAPWQ